MKQNIYDDPQFFADYQAMRRADGGLNGALEWPAFRTLLAPVEGRRVLDLGCGHGLLCRHLRERGAAGVTGIDLSVRMLEWARREHADPQITYINCAIEDADFAPASFDLVTSSLALHYVEPYRQVCANVARWLVPRGKFVFSVEHPVVTALSEQWCLDQDGAKRHWPVDHYRAEGRRETRWFVDGVVKYHRTIETYLNTLIDCGFAIGRVLEPEALPKMVRERPDLLDQARRPPFLLISATKSRSPRVSRNQRR